MSEKKEFGLSSSWAVQRGQPEALQIAEFWNELRASDELDPTNWEVLEPIERQVTECLDRNPPNYGEAKSLTAQTKLFLTGLLKL